MATSRAFFAVLAAFFAAQGVSAASYCYCEGSPGFNYLGIETVCRDLGAPWAPVNCDLGSADVCKFGGDGSAAADASQPLKQWCESNERQGKDLNDEPVQGGALICVDSKPDWVDDSCEPLGDAGREEDAANPPIDLGEPVETEDNVEVDASRLLRRADEFGSDFLRYTPKDDTANLALTTSRRNVKNHADNSKETIYQVSELRLKGYDWKLIKSFDNNGGESDHTESAEVTTGFEASSGSETKAELGVNFGYQGLAVSFNIDARLSHEFFSNKKDSVITKRNDTFFVPKGTAKFLYQKVIFWESKVTFRLQSVGQPFQNGDKPGDRGTFTLAIDESEPLEAVFAFDMLVDEKVVKKMPLRGEGTFDAKNEVRITKPLYKEAPTLVAERWTGHVRDYIKGLGFEV
ncbi:hypothetical protein ACHAQH_005667 [Verticillium albo-atrum]